MTADSLRRDERGLATTELAILMPFVLVLLLVVTFAGSAVQQNSRAQSAADAAARAASFYSVNGSAAKNAARAAATQACGGVTHIAAGDLIVDFVQPNDVTFRPGRVVVEVSCLQEYESIIPVGTRTATARSVAAIEYWRPDA